MELKDRVLTIRDQVSGHAKAYLHLAPGYGYMQQGSGILILDPKGSKICRIRAMQEDQITIHRTGTLCSYAPEFGRTEQIEVLEISWDGDGREHRIQAEFVQ